MNSKGFTLIELILSILLIGSLACVVTETIIRVTKNNEFKKYNISKKEYTEQKEKRKLEVKIDREINKKLGIE